MSIKIQCPDCGEPDTLPDSALDKLACCNACGSKFAILHAVVDASDYKPPPKPVEQAEEDEAAMPRSEKLLLGIGLGIPAFVFISFLVYWLGMRDTWETDHHDEIYAICQAVIDAESNGDDELAVQEYGKLQSLIAGNELKNATLVREYSAVERAISEAEERMEQQRIAEKQRREEQLRRQAVNDTDSFYNPYRDPPYMVNDISWHHSRSAAIQALAEQFSTSTYWVEQNMGNSNSVQKIHINLARARLQESGFR